MHGIALGVDGGMVVDRCPEKRNHPFVDIVYSVVADPVGEPGSGDGCGEAIHLGLRPHGHVAAVAVAADAEAVRVDRILLCDRVDASHDVAIVAAPEVFDIAPREGFALTVTATRIRAECEIPHRRLGTHSSCVPARHTSSRRASVHVHNEWIFLVGREVFRKHQPAFKLRGSVRPVEVVHTPQAGLTSALTVVNCFHFPTGPAQTSGGVLADWRMTAVSDPFRERETDPRASSPDHRAFPVPLEALTVASPDSPSTSCVNVI